jgi:Peptidase family M28
MPKRAPRLALACGLLAVTLLLMVFKTFRMPGRSYDGPASPLNDAEKQVRADLKATVEHLSGIGERSIGKYANLTAARDYIETKFKQAGYQPRRVGYTLQQKICDNIEAEISGGPKSVVIGAHYDTVPGSPGANDNGSGVAALLALAKRLQNTTPANTLRFVAFVNEEPFHFQSPEMGSWIYAKRCRDRGDDIVAMISLETIGYFSQEPGSQVYPVSLLKAIYPDAGNFIGFVGNLKSSKLVRRCIGVFRNHARIPSEGAILPEVIPGVGWSDHWSFWQHGYEAIMITDTALFRYPYYHSREDTAEKIDFDSMTRVVTGLEHVIENLVR